MPTLLQQLQSAASPIIAAWGDPLPAWNDQTRRTADCAVDGVLLFRFNGLIPTTIGRRNIDWSGKHHQHQEWPAQLNRFFTLGSLARAWLQTGQSHYVQAARDYIEDWIASHPTPQSSATFSMQRYDNVLNLGLRMGDSQHNGWLGTLPAFMSSPIFDEAFVRCVIDSAAAQLNYLSEHPAPTINWRIANADALLLSGIRISHHPSSQVWRRVGVRLLNDAFRRQVLRDGAHMERTPGYHHWMTRVADKFVTLARHVPEIRLDLNRDIVAGLYDYAVAALRPNGAHNGIHDSQGSRITPDNDGPAPSRNAISTALQDRAAFRKSVGLPEQDPPTSAFFLDAGQAYLRTDWSPDATYVTFDATTYGGGHCHLSRNAIQIHAFGKTLLPDPGWLTYEGSDPASFHGKSTRAHNTLNLNGWNQSSSNPSITRFFHADARQVAKGATLPVYDLCRSDYEGGYWQSNYNWGFDRMSHGIWASHCRIALFVHDLGVLVIDNMYRVPTSLPESDAFIPSVEANWQLMEGDVNLDLNNRVVHTAHERGNVALHMAVIPEGAEVTMAAGIGRKEEATIRGWLPTDDGLAPASQVRIELPHMHKRYADFVTMILPFAGSTPAAVKIKAQSASGIKPGWLELAHADGRCDQFAWMYRMDMMLGSCELFGGFETDASFIHIRLDSQGNVMGVTAFDGTYITPSDARRQLEWNSIAGIAHDVSVH